MNLYHKLHYANKRRLNNFKMGVFAVILIAAGLVMLYSSVILSEGLNYGKNAVRNSLSVPVTSCGLMKYQDDLEPWEKCNEFVSRIYALDEIKAFGTYSCNGMWGLTDVEDTDYWKRILEIQHSGELEFEDDNTAVLQIVMMNSELFDMEKFDLIAGEKIQPDKSGRYRLFLGYNFREIPVGTEFKDDYYQYEVAGIMKKGTYVMEPELLTWNLGGLKVAHKIRMDNMVLMLMPEKETLSVLNLFCVNDGYTYEDAVTAMEKVADEWGIIIDTGTLQDRLDYVFLENKKLESRINMIALIIGISVFMICVTIQLLNIYIKRNEMGIWLANGMTRKEIFEIIWLENFIKVMMGGVIAVIVEGILVRLMFMNNRYMVRTISSIMYGIPLLKLVGFALLMVCIISVIPVMIIAKRQTTELVKGVWS